MRDLKVQILREVIGLLDVLIEVAGLADGLCEAGEKNARGVFEDEDPKALKISLEIVLTSSHSLGCAACRP